MAKIVFTGIPGYGHVYPTLPVVAELRQRGHGILYYNTADFKELIVGAGARFCAYPDSAMTQALTSELAGNPVNITILLLEESRSHLPFLLDELQREQPDVVVFDSICLWGMQATQLLDLPSVGSITTLVLDGVKGIIRPRDLPFILRSSAPKVPRILKRRRELVQTHGKAVFPNKGIFPCVGDRNILFTSAEFQPMTSFIDERFFFVGPALAQETRPDERFSWVLAEGEKRVYVSLGTVNRNSTLLHTVMETFADHPAHFLVSTGGQADPILQGKPPDNFTIRRSVPQLQILQEVDLFITHGGNNSVHEGLYNNVPLLILPQQTEQTANGRLVAQHGAGIVLGDRPPYGQRVPEKALHEAVERLLSDDSYRNAATRLGASFHEAGGAPLAADVIESMVTEERENRN